MKFLDIILALMVGFTLFFVSEHRARGKYLDGYGDGAVAATVVVCRGDRERSEQEVFALIEFAEQNLQNGPRKAQTIQRAMQAYRVGK